MRRKVSVFLPDECLGLVDEVARERLGIGRSAFMAAAALYFAARFLAIMPRPKRRQSLAVLDNLLVELRERVEKAL